MLPTLLLLNLLTSAQEHPATGGFEVHGDVVIAESVHARSPIPGALVSVTVGDSSRPVTAVADAEGRFRVKNAAPLPAGGIYHVEISMEGLYPDRFDAVVPRSGNAPQSGVHGVLVYPGPDMEVTCCYATPARKPEVAIFGTVNANDGRAVPYARIEMKSGRKTWVVLSNKKGEFRRGRLPLGNYSLRVTHPLYISYQRGLKLVPCFASISLPVYLSPRE